LFDGINEVEGSQFATEKVPPCDPAEALLDVPLELLPHAAATMASAMAATTTRPEPLIDRPPVIDGSILLRIRAEHKRLSPLAYERDPLSG
jgi:hypothetical protein